MDKKIYIQKNEEQKRRFIKIDGEGLVLGRMATEIVRLLKGKDQVTYTPHVGGGTQIIVVNANKIKVTGDKENQKIYRHYTGYVGGLKEKRYKEMEKCEVIIRAVKCMINKGPMRNLLMKNLRVYNDSTHPHEAQKPVEYKIKG